MERDAGLGRPRPRERVRGAPGGERAADPGTYQLRVLLDGKDTGNHVVFDVGAAPTPKPSPPPQPQSGGQSGAQSR
ncbi:biotin/lipoate A/B protein ligase [Actinomyces sp. oral taxon 178 str. F0338]|nr:biotin/lipoate A/B protein ligase [Actinomyces sp. oral taxon 178 str. F0338]